MNIRALTVPYDSGRYRERMGRGPDRLFEAGLKPMLVRLGHKVDWEEIKTSDSHPAEIKTAFALCRSVSDRVRTSRDEGYFPMVLSGNCGIAVGTVSGCGCQSTGVVWFDAHGESNTPDTTASGFLDGMPISILTGQCWGTLARSIPGFDPVPGEHVVLVGSRDVEPSEIALMERTGVTRVSSAENLSPLVASMARQVDGVYVHFDLDVLDPTEAVANPWATPGGLTIEALKKAAAAIQATAKIKAIGIASYDPAADHDGGALGAVQSLAEILFAKTT